MASSHAPLQPCRTTFLRMPGRALLTVSALALAAIECSYPLLPADGMSALAASGQLPTKQKDVLIRIQRVALDAGDSDDGLVDGGGSGPRQPGEIRVVLPSAGRASDSFGSSSLGSPLKKYYTAYSRHAAPRDTPDSYWDDDAAADWSSMYESDDDNDFGSPVGGNLWSYLLRGLSSPVSRLRHVGDAKDFKLAIDFE